MVNQKYVKQCSNLVEAIRYLKGERPLVSKGALISKLKDGVLKHRLTLDSRTSGANDATHKWERILLPRAWDVVQDATNLKRAAVEQGEDPSIWHCLCDVSDAFLQDPLTRR